MLKIQIKPTVEQKKIFLNWFNTSNYVYNKTVALINKDGISKLNFQNLRDNLVTKETKKYNQNYKPTMENIKSLNKKIKDTKNIFTKQELKIQLQEEKNKLAFIRKEKNKNIQEWELKTPKEIRAGAVNDVCKAYKTGFSNLKAGNIKYFKLQFRKSKNENKCLVLPKSFIKNTNGLIKIAPKFINDTFKMGRKTYKKHKHLLIEHDCRLIKQRSKYWLCIPVKNKTILNTVKTFNNYCGIDPGIKTFLTSFGNKEIVEYKQNKDLLKKLNDKLDYLKAKRTKKKSLTKIEERKENVINEIHWKSINEILKTNDCVFLGDIKSHDIVKHSRFSKVNRFINDLKFFKFKTRLQFKAILLNKKVFMVNERYTTKTCSCCGNLKDIKLGESIYKCNSCNIVMFRDVNASKNILMKGIQKYL